MNLQTIQELAIASNQFDFSKDIDENIDHSKWIEYVNRYHKYFIWAEDTEEGKATLAKIDKVPESFRERTLKAYNKNRCYAEYNNVKKYYDVVVSNYDRKISISFERKITKEDLTRFLDMANSLGAYLLNNGSEIIDERIIESLV